MAANPSKTPGGVGGTTPRRSLIPAAVVVLVGAAMLVGAMRLRTVTQDPPRMVTDYQLTELIRTGGLDQSEGPADAGAVGPTVAGDPAAPVATTPPSDKKPKKDKKFCAT